MFGLITDDIKTNKNTIIIENGRIDYGTMGIDITSKSGNQSSSIILFGGSFDGNSPNPMGAYNMKVYRLKLYEEDELVREYVPCYRESDNEIGLYELLNNVFYTNNGTGTFNKGNDIVTSGTMTDQHFVYNVAQNVKNNPQNVCYFKNKTYICASIHIKQNDTQILFTFY